MAEDCVKFVEKDVAKPSIQVMPKAKQQQQPSQSSATSLSSLNSAAFNEAVGHSSSPPRPHSNEDSGYAKMLASNENLFAKGSNNTVNSVQVVNSPLQNINNSNQINSSSTTTHQQSSNSNNSHLQQYPPPPVYQTTTTTANNINVNNW